ncbi:MAG TPA: hypothetical protein VLY24_10470 [Bryobacteraceae bacterium]|nr:hypothetical protein [Bryobacteraceae bacterium]
MKTLVLTLLPATADNTIHGATLPAYLFAVIAVISLVRSSIHILARDGGAGSIAGMDLSVSGGDGIVFAFGLWGSAQLVYAFIQLAVAFRYRSLVPAMYLLLFVETLLRMLVGRLKPATFAHKPPGAIGNYVILPLSLVMLAWSLWP